MKARIVFIVAALVSGCCVETEGLRELGGFRGASDVECRGEGSFRPPPEELIELTSGWACIVHTPDTPPDGGLELRATCRSPGGDVMETITICDTEYPTSQAEARLRGNDTYCELRLRCWR